MVVDADVEDDVVVVSVSDVLGEEGLVPEPVAEPLLAELASPARQQRQARSSARTVRGRMAKLHCVGN